MIVSKRIGMLTPEGLKSLASDNEALLLTGVIYYATLTHAMPKVIYEKLQVLLKEIFIDVSHDSFCHSYPWIRIIDESDWSIFQRIASCWADTTKYSPPLGSVKELLEYHCQGDPWANDSDQRLDTSELLAIGFDMIKIKEMEQNIKGRKEHERKQKEEFMKTCKDMSNWPLDVARKIFQTAPEGVSKEQLIECAMAEFSIMYDNITQGPTSKDALVPDKTFFAATKTILPPFLNCNVHELEGEIALARKMNHRLEKRREPFDPLTLQEVQKECCDYVHNNWTVNPVKVDPDFHFIHNDRQEGGPMCAVKDFPRTLFHEDIRKNITIGSRDWHNVFCDYSLSDLNALFYTNIGNAISNLVDDSMLSIEISYGSIIDFGIKAQIRNAARADAGLSVTFSRMMLSNVPDYVGLLSTFMSLGPLMADASEMQFILTCNVL